MKSNMVNPPIYVQNPRRLPLWSLPARRTAACMPVDYKPSIALLPDGELVMATYQITYPVSSGGPSQLARSSDGGKTWSQREVREELIGAEPYITSTSKGTLFITASVTPNAVGNDEHVYHAWLHRSTDGGHSWEGTKFIMEAEERCGVPLEAPSGGALTRNLLELPDGTLLCGACMSSTQIAYLWRSTDEGRTWEHGDPVSIGDYRGEPYDNWDGFFHENFLFCTQSGKLLNWIRVGPPSPMHPMNDGRPVPFTGDQSDRTMLCESTDGGRTWTNLRDFGGYGMMYPRVIRLQDGRLLLNYTQRSLYPPLGLRAIFSYDDGETWDFENDLLIIDGKTPVGAPSGGSFGNTLQLADGTLVSCYSYRGADEQTHVEVARWRLPVSNARPFFFDRGLLEMKQKSRLTVLHDWSDASPVEVEFTCGTAGSGRPQARVTRAARTVQGETFAAKLELFPEAECGAEIAGLTLSRLPVTDWSESLAVAVRLHNPTGEEQEIGLRLMDEKGTSYLYKRERFPPGRTGTICVELGEIADKLDEFNMTHIGIFTYKARATQFFLAGPVCLINAGSD